MQPFTFNTPEQLFQFTRQSRDAAVSGISELTTRVGVGRCYYVGQQWISDNWRLPSGGRGWGRYATDWSPDSRHLRATVNRVTKYVRRSSAATFPNSISVDVLPGPAEAGIGAVETAQVVEDVAHAAIDSSGMLVKARIANDERCICGSYILAVYIQNGDAKVTAFEPYRMVLDPFNRSPDLNDHDYIGYVDVWTFAKIKRVFPDLEINEDDLNTVGELLPMEVAMGDLSGGRIGQDYSAFSKSKGAIVQQWHFKDDSGRFSRWYVVIETKKDVLACPNFENPETPFGGNGNPYAHIRGHYRPTSPWGISDVGMLKDDQDRLNLLYSLIMRQVQKNGGYQWLVDRRSFPSSVSEDDLRNRFTNAVAGVVMYESRPEKGVLAPSLMQYPPPQPGIIDMANTVQYSDMQDQVFRSDINKGVGKSHVPDSTTQTLLQEGNQVLGIRAQEDAEAYEHLVEVLTGTYIKLAQQMSPPVLASLGRAGLVAEDFAVLSQVDPQYPSCNMHIRAGSTLYRDPKEREATLDQAAMNQMISAIQWRVSRAEDVDAPVLDLDRRMIRGLTRKVSTLLYGNPWQPMSLGEFGPPTMAMLREAALDPAARDPAIAQLVAQAIEMQQQQNAIDMQMEQGVQSVASGSGSTQPVEPPEMQSVSIGDLLSGAA